MRKFKTAFGTGLLAVTVLSTSLFGGVTISYADSAKSGVSVNSGYGLGNIELSKEERAWLNANTEKIEDINDVYNLYSETGNTYFNNIKRGKGISRAADNSKSKYFPAIGNQGEIGSCASWAMTYLQASYTLNKQRDLDGKDTKNVMSPMWSYNMTNQGANNGSTLVDVVYVLSNIGAVSIEDVPAYTTTANRYQYGDLHARDGLWLKAAENKMKTAYMVDLKTDLEDTPITSPDDEDLTAIKALLDSGEILSCSSYAYKWKTQNIEENDEVPGNANHVGEQIVTRNDGYQTGGHRIAIVGYDDDIWADINQNGVVEEGEKGAFKIANSWGEEWGNDGCIWFSYDSVNPVSSVADTSYINLSRGRAVSLMDIVGMTAQPVEEKSNTFAEFTMNSPSATTVKVDISATNSNGEKITYGVVPFRSSQMYYSVGNFGFDGTKNPTDGTFTIDLQNVIEGLQPEQIKDYAWEIRFTDTVKDSNELVVKEVKLIDTANQITYASDLMSEVAVNGGTTSVTIK